MLEESIIKEFREGRLDFVKGVLVASGETEVEQELERIDSAARKMKAELGKDASNPKAVFYHTYMHYYKDYFRKVPVPDGGDCLFGTILQNTFLSRLGFKCSVLRYVLKNTTQKTNRFLFHIETCVDKEEFRAVGSYLDSGSCWVCGSQEFSNHSLIAYTYYQRGTDAFNKEKNFKLSTELYEKASIFEEKDFKIWLELGKNYELLGDTIKAKECLDRSESLKPKLRLIEEPDILESLI